MINEVKEMDTKIVFFDIDGTLIDMSIGMKEPSQKTKEVIKKFRDQGHVVVIASARGELPFDDKDMTFDGYIFSEGHRIILNDEVLVEQEFELSQIKILDKVFKKYNAVPMYYGQGNSWIADGDHELVVKHRMIFSGANEKGENESNDFDIEDVHAISCCALFPSLDDLKKAAKELDEDFTMVPYEKGLLRMDIYCKGYTKGTACEYVYKKLGIDYENTYCFGDGLNDLKMFELVKHSIAMGNSVEELKAIAYDVTDDVDQEGIAKAFHKYFDI